MSKSTTYQVNITFRPTQAETLKKQAEAEGRSLSNLVRHICDNYLRERKQLLLPTSPTTEGGGKGSQYNPATPFSPTL